MAVWRLVPNGAHMVWGGGFLDAIEGIDTIDFAGGNMVHISSAIARLVLVLVIGQRREYRHIPTIFLLSFLELNYYGSAGWVLMEQSGISNLK